MSDTWKDRMFAEKDELQDRLLKLEDFLSTEPDIGADQLALLKIQASCMRAYRDVLTQRIVLLR